MENTYLEIISKDENRMEDFMSVFDDAVRTDEEIPSRKFTMLYNAYKRNPDIVNDILITLCGWSMESLANRVV